MPVLYGIKNDTLKIIQIGAYTSHDFRQVWLAAISDPEFQAPMKVLMDGRMAQVNPSTQEIDDRASFIGRIKSHFALRWAYVAKPDSLVYGLARMASSFLEEYGIEMGVFANPDQASAWLSSNRPSQSAFNRALPLTRIISGFP